MAIDGESWHAYFLLVIACLLHSFQILIMHTLIRLIYTLIWFLTSYLVISLADWRSSSTSDGQNSLSVRVRHLCFIWSASSAKIHLETCGIFKNHTINCYFFLAAIFCAITMQCQKCRQAPQFRCLLLIQYLRSSLQFLAVVPMVCTFYVELLSSYRKHDYSLSFLSWKNSHFFKPKLFVIRLGGTFFCSMWN